MKHKLNHIAVVSYLCMTLMSSSSVVAAIHSSSDRNSVVAEGDSCRSWKEFVQHSPNNVLLDFSYAGYHHGEIAPPKVSSLGYTVYNVKDFGAIPDDDKSDRDAVLAIIKKIGANKANANAVIYFPKGNYILHTAEDDVNGVSNPLTLVMGHVVIKGDGRDKTFLSMQAPNQPKNPAQMWTSPVMLTIRNNGGKGLAEITSVTENSPKGSFSITVQNASDIKADDWVCLKLLNNNPELVRQELGRDPEPTMTNIVNVGVQVYDYHQVKNVSGNTVTFYEPLMHAVESRWGWTLCQYPHYEEVGIEDLTFVGHAKKDFVHHGSWEDDGAYKPISFGRMVNSWMRRVGFKDVSEACSIQLSANVSAYDIIIEGSRGHSSVRSEGSSRVFIGAVKDNTDGYLTGERDKFARGAGQFHACGVSKQSIGTVIYNATWGSDNNFESHATQPRATLFDNCRGAFAQSHMGGDRAQLPNHLDDLTIWNFEATGMPASSKYPYQWWSATSVWNRVLPPTIIGFHGYDVPFDNTQVKRNENQGKAVVPASLYAAQLKARLGKVPAWLNECR